MATRGTEFIGTELLKEVAANYDHEIEAAQAEISRLQSEPLADRYERWRKDAEERLTVLAHRVLTHGDVTDAELSGFKIDGPPGPGDHRWTIQSLHTRVESLGRAKRKALAYINSLAADKGVVTLYAADLRRIGYGI